MSLFCLFHVFSLQAFPDDVREPAGPLSRAGRNLSPLRPSCLIAAVALRAEVPIAVVNSPEVQHVLSGRFIRVDAEGRAAADFQTLLAVNRRPDLLKAILEEYAAMLLEEGKTPEFSIEETGPGQYFYSNREKDEAYITELLRSQLPDGKLHAVYGMTGKRFFGSFAAVVHVEIAEEKPDEVTYFLEVYALPENKLFRVVARGLRFAIESYFVKKTRAMTDLMLDICSRLVGEPAAGPSRKTLPLLSIVFRG
jgi:hypothetical protein